MDTKKLLDRLTPPTGKVRMILDTDAACEVDDQFAIAYSLLSPDNIDLEAIYLEPYYTREDSPTMAATIENSYHEAVKILTMLNHPSEGFVFRGATEYLSVEAPQATEVTKDLIKRAMAIDPDEPPLYIGAIGTITNIAAAILLEPQIIERIVVIWLGGSGHHKADTLEHNLSQDIAAVQTVLNSGVPFIQMVCQDITSHLVTSVPELEYYLKGRGEIGEYLLAIVKKYGGQYYEGPYNCWSKVLWDVVVPAWIINSAWVQTDVIHSPILTSEMTWSIDTRRHFVRVSRGVDRDEIFRDFFSKLESFCSKI